MSSLESLYDQAQINIQVSLYERDNVQENPILDHMMVKGSFSHDDLTRQDVLSFSSNVLLLEIKGQL